MQRRAFGDRNSYARAVGVLSALIHMPRVGHVTVQRLLSAGAVRTCAATFPKRQSPAHITLLYTTYRAQHHVAIRGACRTLKCPRKCTLCVEPVVVYYVCAGPCS